MPFSHHSHSGQFCSHATHTLEEMVQMAIALRMRTFVMTEHMPRDRDEDLYPEERAASQTPAFLFQNHDAYYTEATRLRDLYKNQISIFIGFESDWIRPSSQSLIANLLNRHAFDMFVGSVHHVHTIPIDFDRQLYNHARNRSGGTDAQLFLDYFDAQYEMLQAIRPPVVGHFDLIRLHSDDADASFKHSGSVWRRIERNLSFIAEYGGILEINSASLRKGMREPYPKQEICELFLQKGGRFTLSDDSHSTPQIGMNYHRVLLFLESCNIQTVYILHEKQSNASTDDERFPHSSYSPISLSKLYQEPFWTYCA